MRINGLEDADGNILSEDLISRYLPNSGPSGHVIEACTLRKKAVELLFEITKPVWAPAEAYHAAASAYLVAVIAIR